MMNRNEQALGERFFDAGGQLVLPADGTVTGRWRRLQALTDTQIASAVTSDLQGNLAGVSVAGGVELRLAWSSVELSSGAVLMYH
jgi:hypothetical protein